MSRCFWLLGLTVGLAPLLGGCLGGDDDASTVVAETTLSPRAGTTAAGRATRTGTGDLAATAIVETDGGGVQLLAWSPDGRLLASAGEAAAAIWDANGALVADVAAPFGITGLSWAPDGELLAIGGADGMVRIVNGDGSAATEMTVSDASPPQPVAALGWSPGGELLATASIRIPDDAPPGPVNTTQAVIQLWDRDGRLIRELEIAHTFRGIVHLAWSADGERLMGGGNDIHVWTPAGDALLEIPGGEFDIVPAMAFAPDGRSVAFVNATGLFAIYPVDGGAPTFAPSGAGIESLAHAPDSTLIAATINGALRLFDAGNPFAEPVPIVTNGVEGSPAWSPDGERIALGQPGRAVVVHAVDGALVATLGGCQGSPTLAWAPDGTTMAAGFDDGRICLWDMS